MCDVHYIQSVGLPLLLCSPVKPLENSVTSGPTVLEPCPAPQSSEGPREHIIVLKLSSWAWWYSSVIWRHGGVGKGGEGSRQEDCPEFKAILSLIVSDQIELWCEFLSQIKGHNSHPKLKKKLLTTTKQKVCCQKKHTAKVSAKIFRWVWMKWHLFRFKYGWIHMDQF